MSLLVGVVHLLILICIGMSPSHVQALTWNDVKNPDALCNDFTQAGYYIRRNDSSSDWLVFLEGGGACYSAETCNRRYFTRETHARYGGGVITQDFDLTRAWNENKDNNRRNTVSPLMTSIKDLTDDEYHYIEGTDILSTNEDTNPDFHHYNHILVPYCSSDLWLGDDDVTRFGDISNFEFAPNATDSIQFIFKGFMIFQSVICETIPTNATGTVLLAGSSAGGIGVLNHAKWVKEYLPNANIKVLSDSSWFINFHDNIYSMFTDYTNLSEVSRDANFNITEYVMEQERANGDNVSSLYSLLLHHPPCNSIELGTPCCLSAHCLIANSNYYPNNVLTFVAISIYDAFILSKSLNGVVAFNAQETSFEVNFENNGETEPVGLNFNFLRIIGEYGGVMNSTLDITSHQSPHLSYYVTSCLQHVYLATSTLWGDDGLFGTNSLEFGNDVFLIRHTIEQDRWINFKLTRLSATSDDIEYNVSLRDAIGIWLNTADSTNPVQFREACYLTHCNEMCPEELRFEQDESFLWEDGVTVFVYWFVGMVTLICFIIKGVFWLWHWMLLHKQSQFLQKVEDAETSNAIHQFPECVDKISIACLDLHYSVPFNHKKHKSDYDVMPMVLPSISTDSENNNFDGDSDDCGDERKMVGDVANEEETIGPKVTNGVATYSDYHKDIESETGSSSRVSSVLFDEESMTVPAVGDVVQKLIGEHCSRNRNMTSKSKEKVKVILKGISLYFNPGHLVAIMGPSGSGKTTFLDLLTGHRKYGNTKGNIFINGHGLDNIRDWYIANTGYVLQLAIPYYEELTVRENLTLASQMRLSFSMREKFERIEQVMNETGLQELADTVVGGTVGPGLSGGQKKRLTIALQLLRLPSVIFLDEPTSGLDSASSYELLTYLNRLADSQRTVIMTIHQPRMEIFHMFTRLIMLCEGKVAYHGSPFKAYEVFITALKAQYLEKGLVLPLLEDQNPADVIMDMLSNSTMREAILQYYEESGDPQAVFKAIKQSREEEETTDSDDGFLYTMFGKWRVFQNQGTTFTRMATLEARASLRTTIPQLAYLPVIFSSYGFLLGTVYIQTTSALLIVSGFCVYSVASALFMFPIMHKYYSQALTLYQLEHSDGIGHSVDLVIQGFARFVFLGLIPVILCGGILYLLVIMVSSYSFEVYLQVLVVNMALNQTWIALLIFVLCAFPSIAFRLSPVISSVAGFTSGFFIPRESMPPWYRWLFFVNPNYYGFSSTSYLLLKEFDSNCAGNELECYVSTGDYTLTQFNFNETNPALHVTILLLMTVGYLILAVIAMWIRHADFGPALRRLQAIFFKSYSRISSFDQWLKLESPTETENESEQTVSDIQMTEIGSATNSDQDEYYSDIDEDDEIYFDDIELENTAPLVAQGQQFNGNNKTNTSTSIIFSKQQHSKLSLPTVEEEEPYPTTTYNNGSDLQLEKLQDYSIGSQGRQDTNHELFKKQASSFSLPETGNSSNLELLVRGKPSTDRTEAGSKTHHKLQRRSTRQRFSQKPKDLHLQHRTSRFQSKFLNDDEFHVIWKPDTPNVTTTRLSDSMQKNLSTSTTVPKIDPSLPKSTSWSQQCETVSPAVISTTSTPSTPADLRFRQKQLLERVNVAREVSKDQNIKLIQPEVSQNVKQRALRLASRYVSFRISKKPQNMADVVLQAQKQSLLANSDQPLNPKQKWQRAILLSANKTKVMKNPSETSLSSSYSEIQPISIHTIGQRMSRMSKNPYHSEFPMSQSDYTLSSKSKDYSSTKKSVLKTCASCTLMNTKPVLEDATELENDCFETTAKFSTAANSSVENKNSTNILEVTDGSSAASPDDNDCEDVSEADKKFAAVHKPALATARVFQ